MTYVGKIRPLFNSVVIAENLAAMALEQGTSETVSLAQDKKFS
ncbi:hypothetical protein [Mesonia algae]|nr:hypothetical protein [Mesonia algae]